MGNELPMARSDWALFLDIDGTLLDIAATPDLVEVPGELRANLGALEGAFGGAVALISGRPIAAIDRLFGPLKLSAAGQHGAELRHRDETWNVPPPPALLSAAATLGAFAATRPGVIVEPKGSSIAVHFRLAPEHRDAAKALVQELVQAAPRELALVPARRAYDIKPRGVGKSAAIEWFLARAPFAGRVPVFIGDDTTDEDGFEAINGRGGHSIHVGYVGDTEARFRVHSPAEVRAMLTAWVADLPREESCRE